MRSSALALSGSSMTSFASRSSSIYACAESVPCSQINCSLSMRGSSVTVDGLGNRQPTTGERLAPVSSPAAIHRGSSAARVFSAPGFSSTPAWLATPAAIALAG